jgi:hypothetical protein
MRWRVLVIIAMCNVGMRRISMRPIVVARRVNMGRINVRGRIAVIAMWRIEMSIAM